MLKKAFEKLRNGDHLTDKEIEDMLACIKAGLPLLQSHPEFVLARKQARYDQYTLEGYQHTLEGCQLARKRIV